MSGAGSNDGIIGLRRWNNVRRRAGSMLYFKQMSERVSWQVVHAVVLDVDWQVMMCQ